MTTYNFVLNKLQYGTHEIPWDLSIYLYAGASLEHRSTIAKSIQEKKYGEICKHRVQFISNIFDYLEYRIQSGSTRSTITTLLTRLTIFIKWCDKNNRDLSIDSFVEDFIAWANAEKIRVKRENLDEHSTRKMCSMVANILSKSQEVESFPNGTSLLVRTQFNYKPKSEKDETNLASDSQIVEFGELIKLIIRQLNIETIRGELPITLKISKDKEILLKCGFVGSSKGTENMKTYERKLYLNLRRQLQPYEHILDSYHRLFLVNLRIEAELYLFISQSNMNLSQAISMKQSEFRMMLQDDEYEVFTVYKNRRQGESTFRCYKDYRTIFLTYLQWLKDVGFTSTDSLFPFLIEKKSVIRIQGKKINLRRLRVLCEETGISHISPQKLRTFKSNWLFRNSDDKSVVVALMSHDRKTFERHYRKQNKLESMKELGKYNSQDLVKLAIGLCASHCQNPENDKTIETTILSDCISPEGCLFCVNHKDIRSYDYCFKLISHRYLKQLELTLNPYQGKHPAKEIISRIEQKIDRLKELGSSEKQWIVKAEASIMSGDYHTDWSDTILLLEEMM